MGGFVGEASTGNLTIERCANYGDATAFSTATTGSVEAGGIVASAHSNGTLTINDCYNRGNMSGKGGATSTSEGGGAGGIFARGNNGNSGHVVKINRCYSTGTLTAASGIALRSGVANGDASWITVTDSAYVNIEGLTPHAAKLLSPPTR